MSESSKALGLGGLSTSNVTKISIEHRELPVDVPDSFVGIVKTTPRYPPPPSKGTTATSIPPPSFSTYTTTSITTTASSSQQQQPVPTTSSTSSSVPPLPDLDGVISRLSTQFNGDVKEVLHHSKLTKFLSIYKTVMQEKNRLTYLNDHHLPAIERPSTELVQDIISLLQNASSLNAEAAELLEILTRFELEGLSFAFDQILEKEKHKLQELKLQPPTKHQQQQLTSKMTTTTSTTATSTSVVSSPLLSGQQLSQQPKPFHPPSQHPQLQPFSSSSSTATTTSSSLTTSSGPTSTSTPGPPSSHHHLPPSSAITTTTTSPPVTTTIQYDPLTDAYIKETQLMEETFDPSVRVVRIEKSTQEPLGATVRNEPDGSVIIGRIVKGGAAEKSGLLHEGDEILEVNAIEMKGRNVNQVCDILSEMTGTLTFVIAQRESALVDQHGGHPMHPGKGMQQQIVLRALFDYDPDDDLYIPCRELGICFTKGDILHVIDQSDPNWWQAYREGECDQSLAGLIPSITFQMQRETLKQSLLSDTTNNNNNNNNNNTRGIGYKNSRNHNHSQSGFGKTSASSLLLNCGKRSHQKRKKRKGQGIYSSPDEILTFEQVELYHPRANIKRPIVLIGPTNIGRHELRQRLMMDTDRFAAAVPHTSRPRRDGEIDGVDYHFISRTQFEQDIKDGKFVEHGEYEKNYYGTSLAAIEAVVQSGKICVLNLHVHSIPILRSGTAGVRLKPYFVFVSPPTQMDKLSRLIASTTGSDHHPHHHHLHHHHPHISTADLQAIIDEARDIESRYGHYFDMILTVTDIDRAYTDLMREINALEREPQWIPLAWLK